jgi:hypothetical protein
MMSGASWPRLLANLRELSQTIETCQPRTAITIKLYSFRNDDGRARGELFETADNLGLRIESCQTYLNPYDIILDYAEGRGLSKTARFAMEKLPWSVDQGLALAARDIDEECLMQRIFPIINWDLSVALCHVYYRPRVADNYLEVGWDELLALRHSADHCLSCQQHALHRLDLDVLQRRHKRGAEGVFRECRSAP